MIAVIQAWAELPESVKDAIYTSHFKVTRIFTVNRFQAVMLEAWLTLSKESQQQIMLLVG